MRPWLEGLKVSYLSQQDNGMLQARRRFEIGIQHEHKSGAAIGTLAKKYRMSHQSVRNVLNKTEIEAA